MPSFADGHLRLTTEMLSPDGSARWRRSGVMGDIHAADAEAAAHALGQALGHEVHVAAGDQEVATDPLDQA
jgi:hydroxymethylbilane synthase